jgi:hypothetical protein
MPGDADRCSCESVVGMALGEAPETADSRDNLCFVVKELERCVLALETDAKGEDPTEIPTTEAIRRTLHGEMSHDDFRSHLDALLARGGGCLEAVTGQVPVAGGSTLENLRIVVSELQRCVVSLKPDRRVASSDQPTPEVVIAGALSGHVSRDEFRRYLKSLADGPILNAAQLVDSYLTGAREVFREVLEDVSPDDIVREAGVPSWLLELGLGWRGVYDEFVRRHEKQSVRVFIHRVKEAAKYGASEPRSWS